MRAGIIISLILGLIALAGQWIRPTSLLKDELPPISLQNDIPKAIGSYKELSDINFVIENPQVTEFIEKIYKQTLSRTYKSDNNSVIMLSVAYAETQQDQAGVHYPEVCYPAQGFSISNTRITKEIIGNRQISVKWLDASLRERKELVAYFVLIGTEAAVGGYSTKAAQIPYALNRTVPDALLIRASIIGESNAENKKNIIDFMSNMMSSAKGGLKVRWQ